MFPNQQPNQQCDWNTYPQLLQQFLPSVLNQLLTSGQCDQPTAQRIQNDLANWGNDFCQKIGGQTVTTEQFYSLLSNYIIQLIASVRPNAFQQPQMYQQPGGYQQPGYGQGNYQQPSYGQQQQPASPYAPQTGHFRQQPSPRFGQNSGTYQPPTGQPVNPFADPNAAKTLPNPTFDPTQPPIPQPLEPVIVKIPYTIPQMLSKPEETHGVDTKVEFNVQRFALADGKNTPVDKIMSNTTKSFVNADDAVEFAQNTILTTGDKQVIQFGYKEAHGLNIPRQQFVAALVELQEAVLNLPADQNESKSIISTVETILSTMTRKASNLIEQLIVRRFNSYLECKALHHVAILSKGVFTVSSLSDMLDLTKYGDQPDCIKVYTSGKDYDSSIEHYIAKAITELISAIKVVDAGNDSLHFINALGNTVLDGQEESPTVRDMFAQEPLCHDVTKTICETATVITIPTVMFITNLDIGKHSKLAEVKDAMFVALETCEADIDFFIKDMYNLTNPVDLIVHVAEDKNKHYHLSRTTDSVMLLSKA
jgi:hypothetical protein